MRHHKEVRGSVVFFSLCSSIFLLCRDTALITNPPFYFPIGTGSLLLKCNPADATSSKFFRLLSLLSLCKAYRYDWDNEVSMTVMPTFIWSQESPQVVYFYNYIVQDYRLCFIAGEAGMCLWRVFVSQEQWKCKDRWGSSLTLLRAGCLKQLDFITTQHGSSIGNKNTVRGTHDAAGSRAQRVI